MPFFIRKEIPWLLAMVLSKVILLVILNAMNAFSRRAIRNYKTISLHARRPFSSGTDVVRWTTETTMEHVSEAINKAAPAILEGLGTKGWAIVDDFLAGPSAASSLCSILRKEAETYFKGGDMVISQSTRYDAETKQQIPYDKHNVYSMQLNGGDLYFKGPRLHEYVVALVKNLVPVIDNQFPEAMLSPTMASNKLAVCVGEGSSYDKHYDNSGAADTRKVTALLYLNPNWKKELGGCFRIYGLTPSGEEAVVTDIEPIENRLLVFWSDRLVHSVQPSFAPSGEVDHRWALTVWMTSSTPEAIVIDHDEIRRHFAK